MFAVVQVRGTVKTRREIKDTLKMLRLHHINHCVLIPNTPEFLGMVRKVKDFVAYGEIDEGTLSSILETRGRLVGNKRLTDDYIKDHTKYDNIDEFARALVRGEATINDIPNLKPVLRLHPPRKGYMTIKRTFNQRGALGYYGKEINSLLYKMR